MTDEQTGLEDGDIATIRAARRVCFFAHYHPHGIVADHVLYYLAALRDAGFAVVVSSTATLDADEQAKLRAACAVLRMRENHGLDFGGWIEAVQRFFPIQAEFLLLANDSVYGPLFDLNAFIDRLTAVPADFYGAVESHEGVQHLQSWFLLLRPTAYRSAAFERLMGTPIAPSVSKQAIIDTYEIGFLNTLVAAGLRFHAAYSPRNGYELERQRSHNPMHLFWADLARRLTIPFIKIEVLRDNPMRILDVGRWRDVVRPLAPALVPMIDDDLERRRTYVPSPFIWRWLRARHSEPAALRVLKWRLQSLEYRSARVSRGIYWHLYRSVERLEQLLGATRRGTKR